jgi:membrane protein
MQSPGTHETEAAQQPEPKVTTRRDQGAVRRWTVAPRLWPKLLRKVFREAVADRVTTSAASLAFHGFLAIFPALLAAVALVGLVGLSASQLRSLVHGINVILPLQLSQTIDDALRNPTKGTGGGVEVVLGLAVALWSAVEAMAALQVGLDVAFEVTSDRGFVRRRLVALPLLALTVVLGGAASGLLVLGDPIRALLPSSFALARSTSDAAWGVVRWAGAMALVIVLLSAYYSFGPNRKRGRLQWRPWQWVQWISPGAVAAALGWLGSSAAFSFYVNHFGHESRSYGAFAGVAALLLWLYLTGLVVMLGAELDCELARDPAVSTLSR